MYYGSEQEHDPYESHERQFQAQLARERFQPPTDEQIKAELERREQLANRIEATMGGQADV